MSAKNGRLKPPLHSRERQGGKPRPSLPVEAGRERVDEIEELPDVPVESVEGRGDRAGQGLDLAFVEVEPDLAFEPQERGLHGLPFYKV
jgi:hypothetical protein